MDKLKGYQRAIDDEKERDIIKRAMILDASNKLTLCEQIRFAYDLVYRLPDGELREELTEQLIDIFGTAKKMNARLAHYKRHYGGETGNSGKNVKLLIDTSSRKRIRSSRSI